MTEEELAQIEIDLERGFKELGTENIILNVYREVDNEEDIYGEEEDKDFTESYSLIGRVNYKPKEEQLTDIGMEQDVDTTFIIPSKQLRDRELLDEDNLPDIDLQSMIEYGGEDYNIVNISPKSQVEDLFLEYLFECKRK